MKNQKLMKPAHAQVQAQGQTQPLESRFQDKLSTAKNHHLNGGQRRCNCISDIFFIT